MGYDCFKLGVQIFFSDHDVGALSSKKMCLYRHSTYLLKAHRISNNIGTKITSTEVKGGEGSNGELKFNFFF